MEKLLEHIKAMRRWQKEFKKTKKFAALEKAQYFEREVDFLLTQPEYQ